MSFSTLGKIEGTEIYSQYITGRELGEGAFSDLTLRCGGLGDDTRKISLQVSDGHEYVEQVAITTLGLNIANLVVRDGIAFEDGDGFYKDRVAGRLSSRRDGDRAEIAIALDGRGPGRGMVFDSLSGATFDAPAEFHGVVRLRELRVHGKGATFSQDGCISEASVREIDGEMTFGGMHSGRADFSSLRADKAFVRSGLSLLDGSSLEFLSSTPWAFRTEGQSLVLGGTTGAFSVRDDHAQAAFELQNGDASVRGRVMATDIRARSARIEIASFAKADVAHITSRVAFADTLGAGSIDSQSVRSETLVVKLNAEFGSVVSGTLQATSARFSTSITSQSVETGSLRVDGDVVALAAHFERLLCDSIGTRAPRVSPLRLLGSVEMDSATMGVLIAQSLEIRDAVRTLLISGGDVFVNGRIALSIDSDGLVRVPRSSLGKTTVARLSSRYIETEILEAFGGGDYGNISIHAQGLNVGNIYVRDIGHIELLDSDNNDGTLHIIARNGLIVRNGNASIGSFEPPMLQVIYGQGVRQSGSLYLITPFTGKFAKFQPPLNDDSVLRLYVNSTGQSDLALEIEPTQTRVPKSLVVGPSPSAGASNVAVSAALQVCGYEPYGGPIAEFRVLNPAVDAELLLTTVGNISILTLETSTGHVQIEHRSVPHKLAFHNSYINKDFLLVDTIDGLTQVAGDLEIGGSLYFTGSGGSAGGNGVLSFNQNLFITTGNLGLGNVGLFATGPLKDIFDVVARKVTLPRVDSHSFTITAPPNGSSSRTLGFNAYIDAFGVPRHVVTGSAAILKHLVVPNGSTLPSFTLSFSPPNIRADEMAVPLHALSVDSQGNLSLNSASDSGTFEIKQSALESIVRFETTRGEYSFDRTVHIAGDIAPMQSTTKYHTLRSTDDGMALLASSSAVQGALVLGDPNGLQWRIRISSEGHLLFENQSTPGAGWVSASRVLPG